MISTFAKLAILSLLAALGAFALSLYTSSKLEKMEMIRGDVPGATFVTGTVSSIRMLGKFDQCELEVRAEDSLSRQWADGEACTAMARGSEVTLARLPGEAELHLKNGTWASRGNTRFDEQLLLVERAIAGSCGLGAIVLGIAAMLSRRRDAELRRLSRW